MSREQFHVEYRDQRPEIMDLKLTGGMHARSSLLRPNVNKLVSALMKTKRAMSWSRLLPDCHIEG